MPTDSPIDTLRELIWKQMQGQIVRFALLKLGVGLVGWKAVILTKVIEWVLVNFAKPVWMGLTRKSIIIIDSFKFDMAMNEVKDAKTVEEWRAAVDSLP